jgi:hypothetical protein
MTHVPKDQAPGLHDLALACYKGACNPVGIIHSLGDCVSEVPAEQGRSHPALKMIVGQLSFLLGESAGPTTEAMDAYAKWTGDAV